MIGRLTGNLVVKQAPNLMVDINGVGYDLLAPMSTFYQLPELDAKVVLHTHFAVSETSQQLFGFIDQQDREFFRMLIKVNGVGPKMAVGIMSMETNDIVRCILEDNLNALVKVPGVGKKTAERLIIEMRDKLKSWQVTPSVDATGSLVALDSAAPSQNAIVAEAESALVALGYKPVEASKAVARVTSDEITRSEDLIRLALRNMIPA
ncbi:Holliday junction DNA helicase RuvA [Teredinibacter turnerae T7901]|uniref:Holliday junction branch migration complex subunit RuvA n=1 Tax=Teredinibacter turnerae (strain ATCC 39867 / T7901) TaxID=377629 RepID=RUVA_TERTT|nr:Holliday junction branch migration protein RuvA [Teredinibacter turnerae]C5BQT5.1 RecName: Full=Holliday junction branch migration complex subunit RuvA [Teredinibacter turnerae T7901]ACR14791.1 Holliday junction DNA helicase RuvA [Teredinibacter turnerae T7901]